MKNLIILLSMLTIVSCQPDRAKENDVAKAAILEVSAPDESEVIAVLDTWHKAAAQADFETYFGLFADESSIFMGTDATERWTVTEFKDYARPHFEAGRAWSFTGHDRHVYFNENGDVAWFDEELETPNLGPSRGTGVLTKSAGEWKIAHYNLTVPIPNEIMDDVVEQIDKVLSR